MNDKASRNQRAALFAKLREQNAASEFCKRWREMTKWQHDRRKA